jgi:deoxyribodipyrimidine photo-lyase
MDETPVIFWFRRDLRLIDHPALEAAAERGPVLPLFIDDAALREPSGANRLHFLAASLRSLDRSMGGRLVVRSGDPVRVLKELAGEIEAASVVATADFGPYGRRRDERVERELDSDHFSVSFLDSPYAVPPGTITTKADTPYKVFTPFFRAWTEHGRPQPSPTPEVDWVTGPATEGIPDAPEVTADLPPAGEDAAAERLDWFLDGPVHDYRECRNDPGIDGTSRLSPYLKWGTLHPRQILARLGRSSGEDVFRSEIAWREFYADVLFHRPDSARHAFVDTLASIEYDEGPVADERFERWCRGETGYPIVDAGMRQLVAQGWMHNRVRMIVASFLVKDLHLDWTRGARWFMQHLVDGDLASNNHGWQWVAGTGTDAAPYFRVFNPTTQSVKFDRSGTYLRRWIPEIAHLSDSRIHDPANDEGGPPAGYPEPIVDHAVERNEALARYERAKAHG